MAKIGTPEWKPISETRHASIRQEYVVECHGCGFGVLCRGHDEQKAKQAAAEHDAQHSTKMAECCMHATGPVCACGNVLV